MSRLLKISRDAGSTTSPGNLCQCSVTLAVNKCFLMFRRSLGCRSLCPLPLAQSAGTTEKSLAPRSLRSPFRYSQALIRFPAAPSLLQAFQPFPALSAFPHVRDAPVPSPSCWPVTGLFPVAPHLSCPGEPRPGHSTPGAAGILSSKTGPATHLAPGRRRMRSAVFCGGSVGAGWDRPCLARGGHGLSSQRLPRQSPRC